MRRCRLTLGFTGLEEDIRDDLVDLTDQLEQWVIWKVLEGEFSLSSVSRISLSEDGVTVSRDDLTTLQGGPDVLGDLVVGDIFTNLVSHLGDPSEDFLVSETGNGQHLNLRQMIEEGDGWYTYPWRGPARPFNEAANERKGSERADPTKCPVCAYTAISTYA